MQPLRPQKLSEHVTLVEVLLVDDDVERDTLDVRVTDQIHVRLPLDVDPVVAAAIVEAICAC